MIHKAILEDKHEVTQTNVEQLTHYQRVLYEIIREHDALLSTDLYERYRERVDEPKTNCTVRNYLSKLTHYNLIDKEGDGCGRIYHISA